jgi:hypothetical protein
LHANDIKICPAAALFGSSMINCYLSLRWHITASWCQVRDNTNHLKTLHAQTLANLSLIWKVSIWNALQISNKKHCEFKIFLTFHTIVSSYNIFHLFKIIIILIFNSKFYCLSYLKHYVKYHIFCCDLLY